MEPDEPGNNAAQTSSFGPKAGKPGLKETQRKDPKNAERIKTLRWPGSDV